jgi:hypothetical protein
MMSATLFLLEDDFLNHLNNIPMSSEDQFTDMSHVSDCLLNGVCIPDVIVVLAKYVCLCVVACIMDNIVCNPVKINIVSNYLGQNTIGSAGAIFNGTAKKIANPFSAEAIAKLPFIKVVGIPRDPQHVISFAAASNTYQPSRLHLVPSGNAKVISSNNIRDVTDLNNLYFDVHGGQDDSILSAKLIRITPENSSF